MKRDATSVERKFSNRLPSTTVLFFTIRSATSRACPGLISCWPSCPSRLPTSKPSSSTNQPLRGTTLKRLISSRHRFQRYVFAEWNVDRMLECLWLPFKTRELCRSSCWTNSFNYQKWDLISHWEPSNPYNQFNFITAPVNLEFFAQSFPDEQPVSVSVMDSGRIIVQLHDEHRRLLPKEVSKWQQWTPGKTIGCGNSG